MLRAKINNEEEEEDLVVVMWKLCFQGAFFIILKTATDDETFRNSCRCPLLGKYDQQQ